MIKWLRYRLALAASTCTLYTEDWHTHSWRFAFGLWAVTYEEYYEAAQRYYASRPPVPSSSFDNVDCLE